MSWKHRVNQAIRRVSGYELQRPRSRGSEGPAPLGSGERLLQRPAFILSPVRSGSTLLRVLLDTHSQIHSPPELHLRHISVQVRAGRPEAALSAVGYDARALEYLLWDRLLHRELTTAGKGVLVNKTPNDVFIVDRIAECWPDARFIYLLRHPGAIARSRQRARPQDSDERNAKIVRRYGRAVEHARTSHPGLTVRYEDLAGDPERVTRQVCEYLGVEWEPQMLDYGRYAHGDFRPGLGDWSENIKSGRIRPPAPPPTAEETPELLHGLVRRWGY